MLLLLSYVYRLWYKKGRHLFGLVAEEGDQVVPILRLLQSTESHLGTGDIFLGVFEVFELFIVSKEPSRYPLIRLNVQECPQPR